jgi:uncharacterized protein
VALPPFLSEQPDGVVLKIKLQPRASSNGIGHVLGNELRINVMAAPVDSAANESLVKLLAGRLECPRRKVELIRGHTSKHKTIKLHGLAAADVLRALSVRSAGR